MPNLIGGIILGYIWQQMINAVLLKYETTLVANPTYGFWGLIILMNWQMIGYMMIIYVAGLQNVPTDLIEAAQIDGATSLTDFIQSENSDGYAIYYHMFVPHRVQQL